jgi:hypothetical protein
LQKTAPAGSSKGKRKANAPPDDDDGDYDEHDITMEAAMEADLAEPGASDEQLIPMASGGIAALREKLHDKMAQLRRGRKDPRLDGDAAAGSRDELLEERRMQRAAMRERRRKETKEKIRREEEARGKKGKGKEKQEEKGRDKGPTTKVKRYIASSYNCLILRFADPTACPRPISTRSFAGRPAEQVHRCHLLLSRRWTYLIQARG